MNLSRHAILMCVALGAMACTKKTTSVSEVFMPKEEAAPVDFTKAATWEAHYEVAQKLLVVDVHLQDGFHAYAPGEKTGKPVTLNILPLGKWKVKGPIHVPAGVIKRLGQHESKVLENNFTLSVPMEGGKKVIYGELVMQVCTHTQCDKPRLHPFMVKVKKQPS